MAHPVFWPSKTFFYPVGNTAPVCLTDRLPSEEDANVLLLGCGDVRNVLYTVYADQTNIIASHRSLDFTCCDVEPAIVARNILLLTLLADGQVTSDDTKLWNAYYHLLIDNETLSLITSQSSRLADLSTDIDTWNSSRYARFIKVCSTHTLSELRRLWTLYAETSLWSTTRRIAFKQAFLSTMCDVGKENPHVSTGARCAGPFTLQSTEVVQEAHRVYWKLGITVPEPNTQATNVNPTFAFATQGDGCLAHYGTCPLYAFHLTAAFAQLEGAKHKTGEPTLKEVYSLVRQQFREWCNASKGAIDSGRVMLRFIIGDVLAVCHTLRNRMVNNKSTAYHPVSAWRAAPLILDGGDYAAESGSAPLSFHVIDSSNLADHIGLLNIILASAPLLAPTPFAVLHTENLLSFGKDPTASISKRLCGDIATISVLLDLAPVAFMSGFSTRSNVHEILQHHFSKNRQFHERIAWKIPSLMEAASRCAETAMDSDELARVLLTVYHEMFWHENVSSMLQDMSIQGLVDRNEVHYCRQTFALLLQHVMTTVSCDKERTLDKLMSLIRQDRLLVMGPNYYNDLVCQLHLIGLLSQEYLNPGHPSLEDNRISGRFHAWSVMPSVVCVVFSVPRHKLKCLDETRCGSPEFYVEVIVGQMLSTFASMRVVFGHATCSGVGENSRVIIEEDKQGKRGDSPAVVAFWVPAGLLAIDPQHTSLSLCLLGTPAVSAALIQKLGLKLQLHSVLLLDTKSVHVVTAFPSIDRSCGDFNLAATPPSFVGPIKSASDSAHCTQATVNIENGSIEKLVNRQEFTGMAREQLSRPSDEVPVELKQVSACTIQLRIGEKVMVERYFPFPVLGGSAKLRIARKSGWIEIVAAVSRQGYLLPNSYPVKYGEAKTNFAPWNVHRVALDLLPALDLSRPSNSEWFRTHIPFMFSDTQKYAVEHASHTMDALTHVKHTIMSIMYGAAGIEDKQTPVFGLHRNSGDGIGTVIFVTQLRLDLASQTVIADAYVLPLNDMLVVMLSRHLAAMFSDMAKIGCTDEEVTEWAHLIPALVERCRDWTHQADCAYVREGTIPLTIEHGELPICDCGRGKVSQSFRKRKEWAPFIPYVTRIAISPLFAVSYLDPVASDLGEKFRASKEADDASQTSRKGSPARCQHCRAEIAGNRPTLICSRCKKAVYCNGNCQRADWKKHRVACAK